MPMQTTTIGNNATSIYGFGCISEIGSSLNTLSISRPLICTDEGIIGSGLLNKITDKLPRDISSFIFHETPNNPTEPAVEKATKAYKENECDGVIAFGGGSSLDLGKAVALMATHSGKLEEFTTQNNGLGKIGAIAPLIAVPTTAGTGSETSRAAIMTLSNGQKRIIASPMLLPKLAILDPELTFTLPPLLTAATGMDAVTHCIEAYLSPNKNPVADAIALAGLDLALAKNALQMAVSDGSDSAARESMLLVSTMGGMAFCKGLGATHAMSHACGKNEKLGLHHGTLNAVLLPFVLRFNKEAAGHKYANLALAMGLKENTDLPKYIEKLNAQLGMPSKLNEMGITSDMVPDLAAHAVSDNTNKTNPIVLNTKQYSELFMRAINS